MSVFTPLLIGYIPAARFVQLVHSHAEGNFILGSDQTGKNFDSRKCSSFFESLGDERRRGQSKGVAREKGKGWVRRVGARTNFEQIWRILFGKEAIIISFSGSGSIVACKNVT